MSIYMIGESGQGAPFGRTFFNTMLEDLIGGTDAPEKHLLLFLTDGTVIDVCKIEELAHQYLMVQAHRDDDNSCEMTSNLIPYGLIYKVQLVPQDANSKQIGFAWQAPKESE